MDNGSRTKSKLESLKKSELSNLAQKFKIRGYSKLTKEELVNAIINTIPPKKLMRELFPTWWQENRNEVYGIATLLGLVLAIIPTFNFFKKGAEPTPIEKFAISDSTSFNVLVLPLSRLSNCEYVEKNYEQAITSYLYDLQERDSLSIKILKEGSMDYCPQNDKEAITIGQDRLADLVLWGQYDETCLDTTKVRIRYSLLKKDFIEYPRNYDVGDFQHLKRVSDLASGYLLRDVSYILYWVQAMSSFSEYNYQLTKFYLDKIEFDTSNTNIDYIAYYNNLSHIYFSIGDYNQSLFYAKKSLFLEEKFDVTKENLVKSFANLCSVYNRLGESKLALEYGKQALSISKDLYGEKHTNTAELYNTIATTFLQIGQYEQALENYNYALDVFLRDSIENKFNLARVYNNIGSTYMEQGEYKIAQKIFLKALHLIPSNHLLAARLYSSLGASYGILKDFKNELQYIKLSVDIREDKLPPKHPQKAISFSNLGGAYAKRKRYSEAITYYDKSISIREKIVGENHPTLTAAYTSLGKVYTYIDSLPQALYYQKKALVSSEKMPDNAKKAASNNNAAIVYRKMGKYKKAIEHHKKAIRITSNLSHPFLPVFYEEFADTYLSTNDFTAALKAQNKAIEYYAKFPRMAKNRLVDAKSKQQEIRKMIFVKNSKAEKI